MLAHLILDNFPVGFFLFHRFLPERINSLSLSVSIFLSLSFSVGVCCHLVQGIKSTLSYDRYLVDRAAVETFKAPGLPNSDQDGSNPEKENVAAGCIEIIGYNCTCTGNLL